MKLFNDRLQSWFISNWKYGPSHDADNIEQNGGVAGLSSLKVFVYKCKTRQQKYGIFFTPKCICIRIQRVELIKRSI